MPQRTRERREVMNWATVMLTQKLKRTINGNVKVVQNVTIP